MTTERPRLPSRELILSWLPTALYVIAILCMALRPSPKLPRITHADKYVHAAAYGVLALLSYRSFFRTQVHRPALFAVTLGFVVGMADEGLQALGKVRTAEFSDLLADLIGTVIGMAVMARFAGTVNGTVLPAAPSPTNGHPR